MFIGMITFCAVMGSGEPGPCFNIAMNSADTLLECEQSLGETLRHDPSVEMFALEIMEAYPEAKDIDIVWGCIDEAST